MKPRILTTLALIAASCSLFACSDNSGDYDYEKSNLALESPKQSIYRPYQTCEKFNQNKYSSYPILKGTTSTVAFEAFGKKLAKDFIGIDTPTSTTGDEITYEKDKKNLILDKKTYQITFLDDSDVSVQEGLKKKQILDTVRGFIRKYRELGQVEGYYLVEQNGGDESQVANNNSGYVSPVTISSYSVIIRQEFYNLALLGGVGVARFEIYAPNKINKFKIKFITTEQTAQTISSKNLLLPDTAKLKAKELYQKQFGESPPSTIACRLGYLPNSFKSLPDTIAPGYIFEFKYEDMNKTKLIFLPATTDPSIVTKYNNMDQNTEMEDTQ